MRHHRFALALGAVALAVAACSSATGAAKIAQTPVPAGSPQGNLIRPATRVQVAEPADAPRGPVHLTAVAAPIQVAEPADAPRGPVRTRSGH
jgi:hypothetical protein